MSTNILTKNMESFGANCKKFLILSSPILSAFLFRFVLVFASLLRITQKLLTLKNNDFLRYNVQSDSEVPQSRILNSQKIRFYSLQ